MTEIGAATIEDFVGRLASNTSTPGGGAAAGLAAALGAAMIEMACGFAIGKKRYASAEEELRAASDRCREIRIRATELAELDAVVYQRLAEAFKRPRHSDLERESRTAAISDAAKAAAAVPLELADLCCELIDLGTVVAANGNPNLIGDSAGGVGLASGALRVCRLNIKSNVSLIDDDDFVASAERRSAKAARFLEAADRAIEGYL